MPRFEDNIQESIEYNGDKCKFEDLTPFEKLDMFLHWNGIQGWTRTILTAVKESKVDLRDY